MSSTAARFTVVCVSLVVLWSILAGSGHAAIDPESIIAIWTFEEGRGEDVKDVSGNGNDGFFLGKPKWVDGQFGTALDFASLGDVVQIAEFGNVAPTKEATLTVWTKLGDTINCDNRQLRSARRRQSLYNPLSVGKRRSLAARY